MWQAFFFESSTKHKPPVENNAWFFFEKVFLKGTSPGDRSLQQLKTVLQIVTYFFLLVFEDLHPCNSYYTILKALGELVLIIKLSSRSSKSRRTTEQLRDAEQNNTDASKPVAHHFNLPNQSHRNMSICGLSLLHGNTESPKNLEQKFNFQLGALSRHGINERLSFH